MMPGEMLTENIVKILQYEYRTYQEILKIAVEKTDALVRNDAAEVANITEKEKDLTDRAMKLGQAREQIISEMAEEYGMDPGQLTIEKLKQMAEEPYKSRLGEIRENMLDLIGKIKARNGINQRLTENAIKYLDFSIQLIAGPAHSAPVYGRGGTEVSSGGNRSLLDVRY